MVTTEGKIRLTAANIATEKDVNIRAAGDLLIRSGRDTVSNANTAFPFEADWGGTLSDPLALVISLSDTRWFERRLQNSSSLLAGQWVLLIRTDLMKTETGTFLADALRLVAIEEFSEQIFLMESGDAHNDWRVAVDLLYRCVESDLVRLYPYGDGMEKLTRKECFEKMSRSDPDSDLSEDWDSAKVWVGTYVVGTIKCVELLATYGLLCEEVVCVLAKGLRQQAAEAPEVYPNRRFASANDAVSHAQKLEECVAVSAAARLSSGMQEYERVCGFVDSVERVFAGHGIIRRFE